MILETTKSGGALLGNDWILWWIVSVVLIGIDFCWQKLCGYPKGIFSIFVFEIFNPPSIPLRSNNTRQIKSEPVETD
jgi:hypothetical protein